MQQESEKTGMEVISIEEYLVKRRKEKEYKQSETGAEPSAERQTWMFIHPFL